MAGIHFVLWRCDGVIVGLLLCLAFGPFETELLVLVLLLGLKLREVIFAMFLSFIDSSALRVSFDEHYVAGDNDGVELIMNGR